MGPLLFQDLHDLRLGELRLAHGNLLARVAIVLESSPSQLSTFSGAYVHVGITTNTLLGIISGIQISLRVLVERKDREPTKRRLRSSPENRRE